MGSRSKKNALWLTIKTSMAPGRRLTVKTVMGSMLVILTTLSKRM
jgi:hypothetical protein